VKADPSAQLKLLEVQQLDSRLDQLAHQLAHLPETVELQAVAVSRAELHDRARDLRIRIDDLARDQKKADADVEQVKGRRKRDQDRIDQGLISSPKDLEHMQHELVSLERRIAELEDAELEVMEQSEEAQNEMEALQGRLAEADEKIATLEKARDTATARISGEERDLVAQRAEAASLLPDPLAVLYEKLRAQKGGVAVAALRARRCGGCQLQLNAADLGRIAQAPADEVLRCEECDRILVRTAESAI
jgi:predicted  nucleic acid-binding Zn-ribbon protein